MTPEQMIVASESFGAAPLVGFVVSVGAWLALLAVGVGMKLRKWLCA